MSKKLLFLFLSAVSLLTVSCVRENAGVFGGPSNKVIFSFDSDIPVTKAELSADPAYFDPIDVSKEFGIENLVIEESVSDLSSLYSLYQTRGVPVYTSNFAELYADNLGVTAFHGGALYKPEVAFSNDADSNFWSYEYDEGFWPDDDVLFFIRAPKDMSGVTNLVYEDGGEKNIGAKSDGTGYGTISFDYMSPGIGNDNSAELQKDLLFSTKKMDKAQNESSLASKHNVLLYHALTGVTFKLNAAGENLAISSIDKITLNGVVSDGSCTIKPVYEGYTVPSNTDGGMDKSSIVAKWVPGTTRSSFSQTYSSSEMTLSNPTASAEKTFMFVPQTTNGDVTLTVVYTYKVKAANEEWIEYPNNVATIHFGDVISDKDWAAGKLHTYQFTLSQSINVAIDDAVDSNTRTKSNLIIKNTGTATSYMRVAVIGNWVYDVTAGEKCEDGGDTPAAITPCPSLPSLETSGVIRSCWLKGEDGYYYYKYPVPGGHTIKSDNTLFKTASFAVEYETMKPYDNCHLQVDIAVQAIRADQVAQVWPAEIVSQLRTTVQD